MEIVICIDCGWAGEFSDLLNEEDLPDIEYENCPDCMRDDVYQFDGLKGLPELLAGKDRDTARKVLDRVERENYVERFCE